jgi:hypothetical protein
LTMLYRSTHRRCRRGAPVKNLAHSASLQLLDKTAPSKFGIKQLGLPDASPVQNTRRSKAPPRVSSDRT